jgi:hypothetical protein
MKVLTSTVIVLALGFAAAAASIYLGAINFAADSPHSPMVYRLIEIARERSIARQLAGIQPPALNNSELIAEGAEHYGAM